MTECEFHNDWFYTCTIHSKQRNITDPITLKGKHLPGKSNKDVQILQIENCEFGLFPNNLQVLFPNLNHLKIQNCNLEHIGTKHIGKLKKMTHVCVTNCKLRRLEGNLFSGLEELDSVDFEGNKIEEIEPEIIDDLKRLSIVNFRNNTNINKWYNRDVTGSRALKDLIQVIRVKCKPLDRNPVVQQKSQELQRDMQTLHNENATLKQTLQDHEKATKMAQPLLGHKKIMEELQKKSINCSQPQKVPNNTTKNLTIRVGGSIFRVNRVFFMARCPVIADWVRSNPEEEMLTLKDVKESTFKIVHDYINTNQLPATADNLEVYLVALKFKMKDLEKEALNLELEISMRKYAMTFRFSEQEI
jgi:hypothetical protein